MGTPAFPNLGKHCSVDDCKLIDFLPFTCDCCNKVFCLDHRSYSSHHCPKANKNDRTVVICPLCAKGVHLIPEQDPNITWESHVNTDCDPSNYEKVTKKKKCPVRGCREILTFSNTIKCRDCTIDHCLKHRLGLDHNCPGPKKPEPTFSFWGLSNSQKQNPPRTTPARVSSSSSSSWTTGFFDAVSSFVGGNDRNGETGRNAGSSSNTGGQVEQCPICNMKFNKVAALIDHVQMIHEKKGVMKVTVDVCPKCSKGFRDPVALVEHVEREHRGMSKA
ncbi:zinc finger AN1 and C2H2 domain-containing stress-associated protein 13 [Rutidosis leptorrhynchoides]|uniref:zinc finger AN1 and C2H2 domain-containing stress-associated protein 13 n=1 Tax=Rutidosis leptorrhynchoides TaxID=125765 RepID=UPI003A99858E